MNLLETHRRLLKRWREAMNLVGPGDVGEHFEDCAAGLRGLEAAGRWADLGSGAGFPGLVLAARFPDLRVTLVDSRSKRCAFLRQVVTEAGIPAGRVEVRCGRVEDLPAEAFDGVTARAFAPPGEALAHAGRLLRPGGLALLFLQEDQPAEAAGGFEVFHVEHYRVRGRERRTVTFQKNPT